MIKIENYSKITIIWPFIDNFHPKHWRMVLFFVKNNLNDWKQFWIEKDHFVSFEGKEAIKWLEMSHFFANILLKNYKMLLLLPKTKFGTKKKSVSIAVSTGRTPLGKKCLWNIVCKISKDSSVSSRRWLWWRKIVYGRFSVVFCLVVVLYLDEVW